MSLASDSGKDFYKLSLCPNARKMCTGGNKRPTWKNSKGHF